MSNYRGYPATPIEERFWSKVDKSGTCWLWTAGKVRDGYGSFKIEGRMKSAHRVAYEMEVGPIPEGMQVDHQCHVRHGVNPSHLRVVTPKQNSEHTAGANRNNRSGYLGVSPAKNGRWLARSYHAGKYRYGGIHNTPEEAAEAARQLRLRYFTHNDSDRRTDEPVR